MFEKKLCKADFVRGELDDFERMEIKSKNDIVRTNFLLENIFSHMLGDKHNFNVIISAINKKENDVLEKLKKVIDSLRNQFGNLLQNLCGELDEISEDRIESILSDIACELFNRVTWDITWSRIMCFFVFVGELTVTCVSKKVPASLVDAIFEIFSRLVTEKIEYWVEYHGDWENIPLNLLLEENPSFSVRTNGMVRTSKTSIRSNLKRSLIEKKVDSLPYREKNSLLLPSPSLNEVKDFEIGGSSTCIVCLQEKREILFLDCRHIVSCENCSTRLNTCPICRCPISQKLIIYLS